MAISHVQPLLLLLASLFFLPVLRAVEFEYCNKSGYDFGNVTRVVISRNPIGPQDKLRISVYGYNKKRFYQGVIDVYAKSEIRIDILKLFYLCKMTASCAIEPGTNFVLPLTDVPMYVPKGDYKYGVALFDKDVIDGEKARMCIEFDLPTFAPILVSA